MGAFEYLSVLISIILALGMTRVLGGVGEMLQARSHRRIYWVHVVWIINLFLYLVIAWWIFYRWRNQQLWLGHGGSSSVVYSCHNCTEPKTCMFLGAYRYLVES